MAYLFSKIAAGLFGVWGVFVVSGANVGFYDPQPIPAPSSANTVYEGLEQPPEALQQPVEATTTTTITTIAGCDDVVNLAQTLGWPVDQLATLRYIAHAESRCMPWAHNQKTRTVAATALCKSTAFGVYPTPIGLRAGYRRTAFWLPVMTCLTQRLTCRQPGRYSHNPGGSPGVHSEATSKGRQMTDRNENTAAMLAHHNAMFKLIDDIFAQPQIKAVPPVDKETWLIRQLKNMRVDAQLSGQEHEATVLTAAIEELGGVL
jgi:hypothetical protein